MKNALSDPFLSTGVAARLAGMQEKTLRNWLDRKQIDLPLPPQGKKQRRLTITDTIFLAVVSAAVNNGLEVAYASKLIGVALSPILKKMASNRDSSFQELEVFFFWYLVIHRATDGSTSVFLTRDLHEDRLKLLSGFVAISISNIHQECGRRFFEYARSQGVDVEAELPRGRS